jgi:hypothetical protein
MNEKFTIPTEEAKVPFFGLKVNPNIGRLVFAFFLGISFVCSGLALCLFLFPFGILIGIPVIIASISLPVAAIGEVKLIGKCPHCQGTFETLAGGKRSFFSIGKHKSENRVESRRCPTCKRMIIVRDKKFFALN